MNIRNLLNLSIIKSKLFLIILIIINIIPSFLGSYCVDGFKFAYCVNYHGFPFPSFILSGELTSIPFNDLVTFLGFGSIGFILNFLILYFVFNVIYKIKINNSK